ncbi:MAG TPA: efflux RND transporter periplasmic adaptor subunit [Gemmatales bacterium]|nr:efflux RND transporter periplasmic adaptor subunit [Gemmatales bacterium]HMP58651.1 efflux RND transporter periplasmic adaptor subunit [Gemmatales bacterium]
MSVNPAELEEKRQQINRLIEEIARLADAPIGPMEFAAEFLQRVLLALAAPAGVMWNRTPQGNLQLQYQVNFNDMGLDGIPNGRACHDELLRLAVQQGRAMVVPPNSGPVASTQQIAPANVTNYYVLLAPIAVDRQVAGLVEVWVDSERNPQAIRGFLQFMEDMSTYAAAYLRNNQLRQMTGQQQVWAQLETFARQIHASLAPREVGYIVVNEARRLLQVDRVAVAGRLGGWTEIEAISGADVIEKRSNLVQTMRKLCNDVLVWNDRLVYAGQKDESLPPRVLASLDAFLTESNSKLLIVMPLRDDRETDKDRPARSVLLVECFEPTVTVDLLMSRVEVVARHAAPAMYNALEHRRIPFRWALSPIANIRDSLRGKRLAWASAIAGALALITLLMIFVPYPLRMSATGKLMPKERQSVYAQVEGKITDVRVKPGDQVGKDQELLDVFDQQLASKMTKLMQDMRFAKDRMDLIGGQLNSHALTPQEKNSLLTELARAQFDYNTARGELDVHLQLTSDPRQAKIRAPMAGTVVTFDLTQLRNLMVKPGDKLLDIALLDGPWEVELRIPETHVGHIREALAQQFPEPLEVDLMLTSHPDRRYKGKLHREGLGGRVDVFNNEPALTARVQVGDDLADLLRQLGGGAMPNETEVRAKIRCGKRAVGYVWFYQLWEFMFEHLIF